MKHSLELGIKLYNQKRYEQAKKELQSLDQKPEENPEIAYYLGLVLTQLQDYNAAVPILEFVILAHPSIFYIFQCRMVLGLIYSLTQQYRLAEIEFRNLLKLGVESPQVYTSLGFALYAQKKKDEAIENLKKALELKSDYASALNNLGFIYAEEGMKAKEAVDLCRLAVRGQPGNPVYLDSLGFALFKAGNFVDSRAYLRKALEISKGNREIAAHLKLVLEKET
ncbi:MAG: tetratricopeptide repeat protein [Spirochaetaceae bacterium]|nr:MAG: tetratricopeptide repeat protein [Spirochaetaceae bacterium]